MPDFTMNSPAIRSSILALLLALGCASGEELGQEDEGAGGSQAPGEDAGGSTCAAGTPESCGCPGGLTGTRWCREDGAGFGSCQCSGGQGGTNATGGTGAFGTGAAAGSGASGGIIGGSGGQVDAAAPGDGGGALDGGPGLDSGVLPDAGSTPDASPPPSTTCNPGELVVGVVTGGVACSAVSTAARDAVNQSCQAYSGWRDSCGACNDAPTKWGSTNQTACSVGASSICADHALGGASVKLTEYVTGGDVNDDDKFYAGLHCGTVTATTSNGPTSCPAGQYATAVSEGSVTCSTIDEAIVAYVRQSCALYLGWRDSCDGCTTAPAKWGRAGDTLCNVSGGDSNCLAHTLGTETVNLAGINTDGDVGGDDKYHLGMYCATASDAVSTAQGACPAGSFVTSVNTDGSVECTDAAALIANAVRSQCRVYWGWRDSCDACTSAPAKWGWASSTACGAGTGSDSSCMTATDPWSGNTIQLFGLNTDGDVDNNDRFFMGLVCQ